MMRYIILLLIIQLIQVQFPPATSTSIADSSATAHFVTVNALVINKTFAAVPLAIYNPNGAIM
jgi:hypothetical protein